MIEDIISKDRAFFLYLNNLGTPDFDFIWVLISNKWFWLPLYALLLYFLYKNYSLRHLFYILIFVALGVVISDQLSGIFKYGFERLRPCHDITLQPYMRIVECGGKFGFYSSHASNTFFLYGFLSYLIGKKYKYLSLSLFIWASVVSYSRVYLGVHFPLDIAVGAIMGFLIGRILAFFVNQILKYCRI